ncbi:hypothetical protein AB0F36_31495 [Streptomyces sp. NPDC029080]|uniref:hypothetical protein n=1 Tax=Streptomyces sp. NPDC029080 TaxID=3155017 RepID=UPI0033D8B3FE
MLVSVENEYGPVCDCSRLEGESVQRVGHILDAAQARPAGKLTGKEQKVQCQHCAMRFLTFDFRNGASGLGRTRRRR